jgi:hypothetical protein
MKTKSQKLGEFFNIGRDRGWDIQKQVWTVHQLINTFEWVPPRGGFLSFPGYSLDIPSWDLCVRLLEKPYKTYILPGSCYGVEKHVRLGFGPGTPAENMRAGLEQFNHFVADYKAGRVRC